MATTRLYITNTTAPYTPATIRGAWDATASAVTGLLSPGVAGTQTTIGIAEVVSTNLWDVLLGRWISQPLKTDYTFTTSDTIQWVIGALESSASAVDKFHVHVYVTTGDSDTLNGALLTDNIGATAWPTTAAGATESTKTLTAVTAKAGDRIVVEIGYQAQNTSTTSFTGTINYGNTGTTDLTNTSVSVTTQPGWVEFATSVGLQFGLGSNQIHLPKPRQPVINLSHPLVKGLVFDAPLFEGGGLSPIDIITKNKGTLASATWDNNLFGKELNFSATGGDLSFVTKAAQNNVHKISFEMYAFVKGAGVNGFGQLFHKGGTTGTTNKWFTHEFDSGLNNDMRMAAGWSTTQGVWDISLTFNKWYHIVSTYDDSSTANNPVVYLNGVPVTVTRATGPVGSRVTDTTDFHIGDEVGADQPLNGLVVYLRYWNRILSAKEARQLYSNPWQIYKKNGFYQSLNSLVATIPNRIYSYMQAINRGSTY